MSRAFFYFATKGKFMSEVGTLAERWAMAGRLKVTLPELGEEVTVRRLQKEALLLSPRLPGALTARVATYFRTLEEGAENYEPKSFADIPVEMLQAMPDVVDAVLIHTLEEPRCLLEGADPSKNEINVSAIPDRDRSFLFNGAMTDWPQMPVRTEGGEVKLEDLASFHSGGQSGEPDSSGERVSV
jgi:hypothetical protein